MELQWWEELIPDRELKTLHFLTQVPPLTFNPAESFDLVTRNVVSNLFEGLVTQDPQTLQPQPGIADEWQEVVPGQVYLFHLRTNTRFSNGDPVMTDDVIYSIGRLGEFQGSELQVTEGPEPRTVRIELSQPLHGFLDHLATPPFAIVSQRAAERHGYAPEHLVSSGPFRMKEVSKKGIKHPSIVVLERNPYYWDSSSVGIDQAVYIPIMDADERLRVFKTRYSPEGRRFHYFLNHGPVMRYQELKEDPELQPAPVYGTIVMTPNFSVKPLDDVRVRQAISLAITRRNIIDYVVPHIHVADALVPHHMRGYPACRGLVREDEAEARRLLAEAGYLDGRGFPELTLTIFDHDYQEVMVNYLIRDLKRVLGITVACKRLKWGDYVRHLEWRNYELLYETWHADVPDPGAFLTPLATDHPFNTPGYSNAEFDELMLRTLEEQDLNTRTKHYLRAEQILIEEMATIPLCYDSHFVMIDEGVKGARLNKAAVLPLKHIELRS